MVSTAKVTPARKAACGPIASQSVPAITLAASSESLLELFDALTREYEQSMQMLMG